MEILQFAPLVQYFRSCFQADNREVYIPSFFADKIENRYFLESADLLEGHLPIYPVTDEWAEAVTKKLTLYAKEKELVLGAHFLVDYQSVGGKMQSLFAPLLLYPANLVEHEGLPYVEIDHSQRMLNPAFVRLLQTDEADSGLVLDKLLRMLPEGPIGFEQNSIIRAALHELLPDLNTEDLLFYPELKTEKELKQLRQQYSDGTQEKPCVVPAVVLGIFKKSTSTQGILNELQEIAETQQASAALAELWQLQAANTKTPQVPSQFYVPVSLNAAQLKTFEAAHRFPLSYVSGPPGTGKSFTIAALAIDFLSRGQSVLIASANNQAVDVVADKIEQDFGLQGLVLRGGKQDYKRELKSRLEALLSGQITPSAHPQLIRSFAKSAERIGKRLKAIEKRFEAYVNLEQNHGLWLAENHTNGMAALRRWWMSLSFKRRQSLWTLLAEYQNKLDEYNKVVRRLVHETFQYQLWEALKKHREQLQHFNRAIRARTGARKEEYFSGIDFAKLSKCFPVWLVNLSDISQMLPMWREMFDLVIIDEATQCDMASAIPVMQRGKKAVVCGDAQQLRHVSFLPISRQQWLQNQAGLGNQPTEMLNYRERSLLDFTADAIRSQEQVAFLNEHYRSFPHIISFSNKEFYRNQLHVILATPQTAGQQRVFMHQTHGKRLHNGSNPTEANALLNFLRTQLANEAQLPTERCSSIGILSPFREQVNLLQSQLETDFSLAQIERHRILVGTAHSFQGEERDIMLLSFALDAEAHPTAFRHLNRADVFNVSITRAKLWQHVFVSIDAQQARSGRLLGKYLQHLNEAPAPHKHSSTARDNFAQTVSQTLRQQGFTDLYEAYPVAGLEIDLLVLHQGQSFCIDLIGYPGDYAEAFPIERYKMLRRVGLPVFPLAYSAWTFSRPLAQQALLNFLQRKPQVSKN